MGLVEEDRVIGGGLKGSRHTESGQGPKKAEKHSFVKKVSSFNLH